MRDIAIKAAKKAGDILLNNFGKKLDIKTKSEGELVTNIDLESEELILSIIKDNFPSHSTLSEEKGKTKQRSDYTWIIDPLDGTHNYIHGLHLFAVSVALEYKKEVILGVVNVPYLGEMYVAEKGKGAFCNGKEIHVSKKILEESFLLFGSRFLKKMKIRGSSFFSIINSVFRTRVLGATAICFAYVASGKAEAYVTLGKPEDVAAGCLILEEAQGMITDLKGNHWNISMDELIGSNCVIHEELLEMLNSD